MIGDGAPCTREDAVEAAWTAVDSVIKRHDRVRPYERCSCGPKEAVAIIAADGRWHEPRLQRGILGVNLFQGVHPARFGGALKSGIVNGEPGG